MIAHLLANLLHFLLVMMLGLFGLSLDQTKTDKEADGKTKALAQLEHVSNIPVAYVIPGKQIAPSSKCTGIKPQRIHAVKTPLFLNERAAKLTS